MSFASAAFLRAPVREYYFTDQVVTEVWSQTAQVELSMPTFHFLDRQEIFDAAVSSFFEPPIVIKRLFFAVEWFTMEATYNEARLVNAMTALETLVDLNLGEDDAYIQSKAEFERSRRALRRVIQTCLAKWSPKTEQDALSELNEKLADLNRRSLLRKLDILTARWRVPLDGIDRASIQGAKQARDRVVHRGEYYDSAREGDADLWMYFIVVRELVVRVLLTAIGFKGRYLSYVGGYHFAEFPPRPSGLD